MINILIMIIYIILSVSGLILFKLGSNSLQFAINTKGILNLQISFISIIGMASYIVSFFTYLILVSKNNLTFLVPIMTGIGYIMIITASAFILKEKITLLSLIGCIIILIGVILVAYQGK